ncbi:hypothetical protein DFAR_1420008 [Desulfarculales bacterium]
MPAAHSSTARLRFTTATAPSAKAKDGKAQVAMMNKVKIPQKNCLLLTLRMLYAPYQLRTSGPDVRKCYRW